MTDGGVLAVDLGTSHTVAFLQPAGGQPQPLLFDGSPLLPSAVWAGPTRLATGRHARHLADSRPDGYEPHPKARVDEEQVRLGGVEIATVDLLAAPLARVLAEAVRVAGGPPASTVLTHPAAWGGPLRAVLAAAAARAGFVTPVFVPEPVAAGAYYFRHHAEPGDTTVLVYDFGGGTFDVSVIRQTPDGPVVLASDGLPGTGGTDLDEAVVGHLTAMYGPDDPQVWQRLEHPATEADRRARRLLVDSARSAKETLSRTARANVHVPLAEAAAPLRREQFERLARPVLDRVVDSCRAALAAAGLVPTDLDAVLMVGGSSRIPLAATLLHRGFGVPPTVVEQPELVVAEGAVLAAATPGTAVSTVERSAARPTGTPAEPAAASAADRAAGASAVRPRRPVRRPAALAAVAGLVVALGIVAFVVLRAATGH